MLLPRPTVQWPLLETLLGGVELPEGYTFRPLARGEVSTAVDRLRAWYPDVMAGAESCHMDEAFWHEQVALQGEESSGKLLYGLSFWHGAEYTGFITFELNPRSRAIHGRLGVVSPKHRHAQLMYTAISLAELIARAAGAEIIENYATLQHSYSQAVLEKCGFKLVGIVPVTGGTPARPGTARRVFEALYVKLLVPPEEFLEPSLDALLPETRRLYEHLFKQR
jgi:RimJ/RimL family protein N-acetyltransferase